MWLRLSLGLLCQGTGWLRQRGGTRDSSPVTPSRSQNQHPVLSTQTVPRSCPRAPPAAHPSMGPHPGKALSLAAASGGEDTGGGLGAGGDRGDSVRNQLKKVGRANPAGA